MKGITLVFDRKEGDLWVDVNGSHSVCFWNVTGVEKDKDSPSHTKVLRNGRPIGGVWYVEGIRERWE